jgi:hypothetical protein
MSRYTHIACPVICWYPSHWWNLISRVYELRKIIEVTNIAVGPHSKWSFCGVLWTAKGATGRQIFVLLFCSSFWHRDMNEPGSVSMMTATSWFIRNRLQHGCSNFFRKGPQRSMWVALWPAGVKITVSRIYNHLIGLLYDFYSVYVYIIYISCGCGPSKKNLAGRGLETHGLGQGRADQRHLRAPGKLIICRAPNPVLFELYRLDRADEYFWGRVPKLRIIFDEILSHPETWVYHATFPIVPAMSRCPL